MEIKSLRVLMEEIDGEVFRSSFSNQPLYYSALWDEIQEMAWKEARRRNLARPKDVRCASYALDVLGIPNHHTEAEQDRQGNWLVYWH